MHPSAEATRGIVGDVDAVLLALQFEHAESSKSDLQLQQRRLHGVGAVSNKTVR